MSSTSWPRRRPPARPSKGRNQRLPNRPGRGRRQGGGGKRPRDQPPPVFPKKSAAWRT
jgi:hypothetical protein